MRRSARRNLRSRTRSRASTRPSKTCATGRMIIVCDDEDRENEGDLTMAAQFATAETINFMAKDGRGLICLTLTPQRCAELDLPPMTSTTRRAFGTAFTVSDRGARRRHHRHLRGRPRAHHPGRRSTRVATGRPGAPGPHVPAAGPAGRRAGARRADRGSRRPGAPRRPQARRRHLRDHERRRHHGPRARPRAVRRRSTGSR